MVVDESKHVPVRRAAILFLQNEGGLGSKVKNVHEIDGYLLKFRVILVGVFVAILHLVPTSLEV